MTEELPEPHPDSPHARMVEFLAESDREMAAKLFGEPGHVHEFVTLASWPSGPDGETDRLVQCTVPACGEPFTVPWNEGDDGLNEQERAFVARLDARIGDRVDTEALLAEAKRRAGYGD